MRWCVLLLSASARVCGWLQALRDESGSVALIAVDDSKNGASASVQASQFANAWLARCARVEAKLAATME